MHGSSPPPRAGTSTAGTVVVGVICLIIGGVGGCAVGFIAASAPDPAQSAAAPTATSTSTPITPFGPPTTTPAPIATPTISSPSPAPSTSPAPTGTPTPTPTRSGTPGTDPRYETCEEANDKGFGPYRRGVDPEYDWYRDPDRDGTVCEP